MRISALAVAGVFFLGGCVGNSVGARTYTPSHSTTGSTTNNPTPVASAASGSSAIDQANAERVALKTPEQIAADVEVRGTKFDKAITYIGSAVTNGDGAIYFLRSWKLQGEPVTKHQLYVTIIYTAQTSYFYTNAANDNADSMDVVRIDSEVKKCYSSSGCIFNETVGVNIDHDYLTGRQGQGFEIRLTSRNGSGAQFLKVPPNYIKGHLMAIGAI